VTRFEDTLRERLVIEPDPRSATQFTPFMEGITVAERDAIVDALAAAQDYAQFLSPVSVGPMSASRARLTHALARLDSLDAGVSE
jgi:hypothetical protein